MLVELFVKYRFRKSLGIFQITTQKFMQIPLIITLRHWIPNSCSRSCPGYNFNPNLLLILSQIVPINPPILFYPLYPRVPIPNKSTKLCRDSRRRLSICYFLSACRAFGQVCSLAGLGCVLAFFSDQPMCLTIS